MCVGGVTELLQPPNGNLSHFIYGLVLQNPKPRTTACILFEQTSLFPE